MQVFSLTYSPRVNKRARESCRKSARGRKSEKGWERVAHRCRVNARERRSEIEIERKARGDVKIHISKRRCADVFTTVSVTILFNKICLLRFSLNLTLAIIGQMRAYPLLVPGQSCKFFCLCLSEN